MSRKRRIFNILRRVCGSAYCLLLIILLLYNGRQHYRVDPTWPRIQETGVLRIATDPSYRPFAEFVNGDLAGLDVDLAREIGARLGVRVDLVPSGIDGLYDALKTGQVDALISALPFDPFRLGEVVYTRPYLDAGQFIVSRDPALKTMADLDGHRIAVEYGSIGDEQARRWARRLHMLPIVHFVAPEQTLAAIEAGQADAAIVDYVTARLYLRAHPESTLQIAPEPVVSEGYAVVTRVAALELAKVINATLEAMASDGTLDAIIRRYL